MKISNQAQLCLGAVHKSCPHKIMKIDPPCPCGHTINFEKSKFLHQKVQTSASEKLLPCGLVYGQPLQIYA